MDQTAYVYDVTEQDFESAVLDASRQAPVLVDFWASWCGPCQVLLPLITQVAESYQGKVRLAKVNIDEQQGLAMQYGVRSVPAVKLFRHGQMVDEFMGALPEGQLRAFIERHVERESDQLFQQGLTLYEGGQRERAFDLVRQALTLDPENYRVQLQAAELFLREGDVAAAQEILERLPIDIQTEAVARELMARVEFANAAAQAPEAAVLEERLVADPDDAQARYQLGARYVLLGDYERAMDQMLQLMQRNRRWGDDAARKALLKVFELLGNEGELVHRYRSKMSAALF